MPCGGRGEHWHVGPCPFFISRMSMYRIFIRGIGKDSFEIMGAEGCVDG